MQTRTQTILELRGTSLGTINIETSEPEFFQNTVLRPILKFQNELIIAVFQEYISICKNKYTTFSIDKKMAFVENSITKDVNLKNTFKGIVIGLFTSKEFEIYSKNSSHYNKRIMAMIVERIKSQLQIFE